MVHTCFSKMYLHVHTLWLVHGGKILASWRKAERKKEEAKEKETKILRAKNEGRRESEDSRR